MRRRRFTLAVCLALLLLPLLSPGVSLAASGPSGARAVGTASASSAAPDLPAMALWPSDLPEKGYGLLSAWRLSVHDLAAWNAPSSDQVTNQEQQFASYGVQAAWADALGLPSTPSDPSSASSKEIQTYLLAFDSADHAHQGYKLLVQGALDSGATPENAQPNVGDESRSVTISVPDPAGKADAAQYRDLYVRTGAIAVDLRLLTYQPAPIPTLAEAQALAKTLLTRIAAVLKSGGPALSQHTLGIDVPENPPTSPSLSAYQRLNGKDLPLYALTAAQVQTRNARFGAAVDVYQQTQFATDDSAGPNYNARLYRFASDAEATAWFTGQVYIKKGPALTNLVERTNAPKLGDQSTEYTFDTSAANGSVYHNVAVLFRVGSLGVSVAVGQPGTQPSIASVEKLAKLQASCLASSAPCAPAPAKLVTATQSS